MRAPVLSLILPALSLLAPDLASQAPASSDNKPDSRIAWWQEARFGMFIHWGLYAIPAGSWKGKRSKGVSEWLMRHMGIPPAEYAPLLKQWDPKKFDASAWAKLAKEAGMRYLVITTKHHDGFCLWDSKHTDWDVGAAPNTREVLKELSTACRAEGLRIGWYHSILDWTHPDYLPRLKSDPRPSEDADYERYVRYLRSQVRELLTQFGKIDVMWFDGQWEGTWTHAHGKALYQLCRELQPQIIVNNRVDKGRGGNAGMTKKGDFAGDFGTPEQEIPATGLPGVDWESCMTMNRSWGYKAHDHNWKSATRLIQTLCETASKGGNLLLNVGPNALGEIPEPSVRRLKAMGRWLRTHGEAIYGTKASPFGKLAFGCATQRQQNDGSSKVYLHVFHWPKNGSLLLPGLRSQPSEASILGQEDAPLQLKPGKAGMQISGLPKIAPNAHASVLKLSFAKRPKIEPNR